MNIDNYEPFQIVKRNPILYDVYLIGLDRELTLYPQFLDFCVFHPYINQQCYPTQHQHLGKLPYLNCKPNYYPAQQNDATTCLLLPENCQSDDSMGNCLICIPGKYWVWFYCFDCPSQCITCDNDGNDEPICISCVKSYSFLDGQCYPCGQFCETCEFIYDENREQYYQKCFKCVEDSKYFISLDGQNCQLNQITNCLYAFQVLQSDYTTNTLDFKFQPNFDEQQILTLCAMCDQSYVFVFETNTCIPNTINSICLIAIGNLNPNDQSLESINCLSSYKYENEVVQFQENCSNFNANCKICLQTDIHNYFLCIECQIGYYLEKTSGQCKLCPTELKCRSCYQQHSILKDQWKNSIRPFYRKYIEVINSHQYTIFGQSQNINDYETLCESCVEGYRLHLNQCIPYCSKTCLQCLLHNDQYICVKCQSEQRGRRQTIINNECIDCPENCAFCRVRTNEEIHQINPLFNNQNYQKYTYQCLKSYQDQQYYYDEDLGLYIQCVQSNQKNGCQKQLTIELNLYVNQFQYYNDLWNLNDQDQVRFKKNNILFSNIVSPEGSFKEFENEEFYTLANSKFIKSLLIKITYQKASTNYPFHTGGQIKQIFSENIFSLTMVEFELIFLNQVPIKLQTNLELINFSKITFKNIIVEGDKQNQFVLGFLFKSLFPQIIILDQIYIKYSEAQEQRDINFQITLENIKLFQFSNILIENVKLDFTRYFLKVEETPFPKSLIFTNINLKNCDIQNMIFFYLSLNQQDQVEFDAIEINSNFTNSTFIKESQNNELGVVNMKNVAFIGKIFDSESFFSFQKIAFLSIYKFSIISSLIKNSTLILLNRYSKLEDIIFQESQILNESFMIVNSEFLSDFPIQHNFSYISFQDNQYDSRIKFIYLKKHQSSTQTITINYLNLINNYFLKDFLNYNKKQIDFSLITIQYDLVDIINFIIQRGYGLNEISLYDSQRIIIENGIIQQEKFRFFGLHQYLNCQLKQVNHQYYPTSIKIFSSKITDIKNLTFSKVLSYNFPIISIVSADLNLLNQTEFIILKNLTFNSNLILKTEILFETALISIQSYQQVQIQCENIKFSNNILHAYIQNDHIKSAGLFLIQCPNSEIYLMKQLFENNLVINSTSNIIYIESKTAQINDSLFINNGLFNYEIIQPHILWGFTEKVTIKLIQSIFQIKSQSGVGQISADQILIYNNTFQNSVGYICGCFMLFSQGESSIIIANNIYKQITTQFQSETEQGAGIYIDGSSSTTLYIEIRNIIAQKIFCRQIGGFLYLKSQTSQTNLIISQLTLKDVFAQQGSAFYISYSQFLEKPQILQVSNLQVINSYDGYIQFLNKFNEFYKQQEKYNLINNRTLIYLEYGSLIQIQDIKVYFLTLESFLILSQVREVSLSNIYIEDSHINNNLITITPFKSNQLELIMQNFHIVQIYMGFHFSNFTCTTKTLQENNQIYQCLNHSVGAPSLQIEDQNQEQYENAFCVYLEIDKYVQIFLFFYSRELSNSGLIMLNDLTNKDKISIMYISIADIDCKICKNGLINFQISENFVQQQLIDSLYVLNSNCGEKGCLNIEKMGSSNNRILSTSELYSKNYEFIIRRYVCENNSGNQGTCIRINSAIILLQYCFFKNNTALLEGGSIYVEGKKNLMIEDSVIQMNKASIGGGLYFQDQIAMNYEKTKTKILKNTAENYGNDATSIPSKLTIKVKQITLPLKTKTLFQNSQQKIDMIDIEPYIGTNGKSINCIMFPTGQKLSTYMLFDWKNKIFWDPQLTFQIIALDEGKNQIKNLKNTYCTIQSRSFNLSQNDNQEFTNNHTNVQFIDFNIKSQNYLTDDLIIYFDNQVPEEIVLQLQFQCNSIKVPIYNDKYPYEIIDYHQNYSLRINIKTFLCQFGEIKNSKTQSCEICDSNQGQYSLNLNSEKCDIKDDLTTLNVFQNQLILRTGFWRPYFDTNEVSYCLNLQLNCLGGIEVGDSSCYKGHIGSLCEQCDLYDTQGWGQFSIVKKFSCGPCVENQRNVFLIIGIIILTLLFLLISVQGNIKTVENCTKFQPFKILQTSATLNKSQSGVLIKMLTNYFQIIVSITTFQLQFSDGLNNTLEIVGNPLQTTTYSLDCFLANTFQIDIQYMRMIWQIILPIFYIQAFLGLYLLASQIKFLKFNQSVTPTTLIYLYIYFQPNLVQGLIELVSFRKISGFQWIQANVSQRYDTPTHTKWVFQFCLPFILLITILIPFYLIFGLFKNRENLEKKEVRLYWGFLYNEYKKKAYFWELIKIFEKELIILFLVYYQNNVVLKGVLVLLITYVYQELNSHFKPFSINNLNNLDYYSANISMITIGLAIGIYITQQSSVQELNYPFFITMAFFNFLFLNQIITKIIMEYQKEHEEMLDKFKEYITKSFPQTQKFLCLKKILKNKMEQRKKVILAFQKIKQICIPLARNQIKMRSTYLIQGGSKNRIQNRAEQVFIYKPDIVISEDPQLSMQRLNSNPGKYPSM
ncbi:unnamed protein product [Paramecium sonneborni]|uniref:Transmembrane protein n=1 Tax=Paramecium sonneborni TaxID=65129 RepID=A0A8S1N3T1_9CILI|nr:unnamed protein product [Paramecium sonneborni]